MQFKKNFSNNLQNLSIKNTFVLQPPPKLDHYSSLSSQNNTNRTNSPFLKQHRHCSSALAEPTEYNKQNYINNATAVYRISECLSSSRKQSTERQKYINIDSGLSFRKIKQGLFQAEELCNRKITTTAEGNPFLKSNYHREGLIFKQSNGDLQVKNKSKGKGNGVRMGSMVFNSLSRGKDNKVPQEFVQNMKKSHSFDRFKEGSFLRSAESEVECLNKDGRNAKYKVRSDNQDDQMLYYCFNCAGPLVKQGFEVDLLTIKDKEGIKRLQKSGMVSLRNQDQGQNSTASCNRVGQGSRKIKIGQQIKCKIIMRLNKLKVEKEQFNTSVDRHLENIDYYYNALTSHIQLHRLNQKQEIMRMKKINKAQPQNYENKLSSSLGNMDYMIRHLQTVNYEYLQEAQALVEQQVAYPKLKSSLQPKEGFQRKIEDFIHYFDRNIKLNLQEKQQPCNYESRFRCKTSNENSQAFENSNSLRFSFEQALQESRRNQPNRRIIARCYQMNPLQEENESDLQQSMQIEAQRKDAFRNLFPQQEQNNEQFGIGKQSPVFKQF